MPLSSSMFSRGAGSKSLLCCVLQLAPWGLAMFSGVAAAHTGHETGGFLSGFTHPFGGPDHFLAMAAVGVWGALQAGPHVRPACSQAVWLWPAVFVATMLPGAFAGLNGMYVPAVESSIAVSVLALGLLIAWRVRMPVALGALLVAVFAMVHGHAHGSELPEGAAVGAYLAGMVLLA